MDVFSRKITAWEVHETECGELAAQLMRRGVLAEGCAQTLECLYTDNGSIQKSSTLRATLEWLGVEPLSAGKNVTGIDLGCKEAATASNAEKLRGRWYLDDEKALATAQRAGKKKQVKQIHARIKNRRKEDTHQFTTGLVERSGAIFVGNVSSKAIVKTNMAKSALDAGWYSLKKTLEYKCASAGVLYQEVNEAPWLINRGHPNLF